MQVRFEATRRRGRLVAPAGTSADRHHPAAWRCARRCLGDHARWVDTLANSFTYVAAPTLDLGHPTDGPVAGGTTVTLTGTGLTGTTAVTFDGVPATGVLVVNDSTVTATAPLHGAGVVDVSVTTPVARRRSPTPSPTWPRRS